MRCTFLLRAIFLLHIRWPILACVHSLVEGEAGFLCVADVVAVDSAVASESSRRCPRARHQQPQKAASLLLQRVHLQTLLLRHLRRFLLPLILLQKPQLLPRQLQFLPPPRVIRQLDEALRGGVDGDGVDLVAVQVDGQLKEMSQLRIPSKWLQH